MSSSPLDAMKITGIVSFFCLTLVSSIAPVFINRILPLCLRGCNKEKFHSILNNLFKVLRGFAGGVMLATGLLHLLPEANEMITTSITHLTHSDPVNGTEVTSSLLQTLLRVQVRSMYQFKLPQYAARETFEHGDDTDESKLASFPWAMLLCGISMISLFMLDVLFTRVLFKQNSVKKVQPVHETGSSKFTMSCCSCTCDVYKRILSQSVLWFSLCVHTFSAALAFGIETSEAKVYTLFGAIIGHHLIEAFSYGVILDKNLGRHAWWALLLYAFSYSALLPIGIGVGMAIVASQSSNPSNDVFVLLQGLIMALACGAFLYVALFEVLMEHNHGSEGDDEQHASETMPLSTEANTATAAMYGATNNNNNNNNITARIATSTSPSSSCDLQPSDESSDDINSNQAGLTTKIANKAAKGHGGSHHLCDAVITIVRFALFCVGFAVMSVVAIWV